MNLLFVNNIPFNPVAGGIERVTDILAKELSRRGYNIFYLCGKVDAGSLGLLNYDFPAKLYQLPEDGLFDNEHNLQFYKNLQKELKIDIVINQRGLGGWFNGLLPFTDSKLISVLHSVPDSFLIQELKSLPNKSYPPFASIKRIIKKTIPFIFKNYWRKIFKAGLKDKYQKLALNSDAIVTLSKKDIDIIGKYVPVAFRNKIHAIGNPTSFELPDSESNLAKQKIILFVGRLTKFEKEPMRILHIWKYLYAKWPDWQLKIVGDGPERTVMKKYVELHNLTNVFFEGRRKNVVNYYKEASFICLTSNFEGWGMTLTEGMQFECIPFTFNNYGAASEIIDDNINGCLIPPFELKQYAKRLSKLMGDEQLRKSIALASIEKVKQFSVKKIADKWEQLFLEL